jgi:CHAP domain
MTNKWMWLFLLLTTLILACDEQDKIVTYDYGQLGAALPPVVKTADPEKNKKPEMGSIIDRFNGVAVYYNGDLRHTDGRNVTSDGYNLGLKWQCVEFAKRYYYLRFNHRMPDPWGHAIDFFDSDLADGAYNSERNLRQFSNPSKEKPKEEDIIVFAGEEGNPFGHIAIVSKVGPNYIEIVQQNVGTQSRYILPLFDMVDSWRIANIDVLGWLRKKE